MNTKRIARRALLLSGVLTPALLASGALQAQSPDRGWQAWLGCWEPEPGSSQEAPAEEAPRVCVVPTSDGAVEFVTLVDGAVEGRERVDASGEQVARHEEGCSGWERVQWSEDGRRVFRRSEEDCEGVQRRTTGLQAILSDGDWLSAQSVSAGGNAGVRVVRYRPVARPDGLPAELSRALEGRSQAVDAARMAAAAPLAPSQIVEASRHLDPAVIEAWLIEREQGFALDGRQLLQLADAGVSGQVIDVMVALSYPRVFAINRDAREAERRPDEDGDDARRPRRGRRAGPVSIWDPWHYPGYGWGYGRRGGYYPGYGYGGPVVIVPREKEDESGERGRAVRGRGYTRGGRGESVSGGSTSRPSSSPGSSRSGGGRSEGGTSTGRTAKPRGGGS